MTIEDVLERLRWRRQELAGGPHGASVNTEETPSTLQPHKLGVGVLGAAWIAVKNARAIRLSEAAEIVAVGSRTLEKAERFVSDNGLTGQATAYGSYDEVLEDRSVQAVYIPLPSSLHKPWVVKAALNGIHILCDKPICLSEEDLPEMEGAVTAGGVAFLDGTMWLHHERTAAMARALHADRLCGSVAHVMATFFWSVQGEAEDNVRLAPDLDGLGCLGDLGWYCVCAALWANQYDMPASATAHPGAAYNQQGVPLVMGGTLTWHDGRRADVLSGFHVAPTQLLLVCGSEGQLRLDDPFLPFKEEAAAFRVTQGKAGGGGEGVTQKVLVRSALPQEALMWRCFADLAKRTASDDGPDHQWLQRSLKTQRVVSAIRTSAQRGCIPVAIE